MKIKIDATAAAAAYSEAFRRLRELPGFDHAAVLAGEMGSILKSWAGKTPVGTAREAEFRARYRAGKAAFGDVGHANKNPFGISVNTGVKGGAKGSVWFRHPSNKFHLAGVVSASGQFRPANVHWKNADWERISAGANAYGAQLAKLLPAAKNSVGLARQSVVQSADALGIDLKGVAGGGITPAAVDRARRATPSTGKPVQNGFGNRGGDGASCFIEAVNRLPYAIKISMDSTLASVLAGRARFIQTSYAKGAFESISRAASAFPNIFRLSGMNA